MKNIIVYCLVLLLAACSGQSSEKTNEVDTSTIGSDNPHPSPDSSTVSKQDSAVK